MMNINPISVFIKEYPMPLPKMYAVSYDEMQEWKKHITRLETEVDELKKVVDTYRDEEFVVRILRFDESIKVQYWIKGEGGSNPDGVPAAGICPHGKAFSQIIDYARAWYEKEVRKELKEEVIEELIGK